MTGKNVFVFVVCGSEEHLDTLDYSIQYLKYHSKNEIWILTDSSRNARPIVHDTIIDINTPKYFDHHQASIYLKTGIHHFVPKGNNYCYLDTDIIALSEDCDDIFSEFVAPIRFAPDHCKLRDFSPHAVNCGCLEKNKVDMDEVNRLLDKYDESRHLAEFQNTHRENLIKLLYEIRMRPFLNIFPILRYFLSLRKFDLDEYHLNKKERIWYITESNTPVLYDFKRTIKAIESNSTYRWNMLRTTWFNQHGDNIFKLRCNHLKEYIQSKFDIKINKKSWQHWNGGVFLFNDSSHEFLEAWHNKTMEIFEDPNWKTRDQGTLIATAWEFGLKNQKTLSKKWNFIADYYNPQLKLNKERTKITDDSFRTSYQPAFIHIYHNFGMNGWSIWDWVADKKP